ncbi:MAG: hypothetical protein ACKE9I_01665 [Methylophagaceae bacterium]
MKTIYFPYIALGLASFLLLVVVRGSQLASDGTTTLPLLTLLVVSEFSFFVTAIGAYIGIKNIPSIGIKSVYTLATVLCALLSLRFLFLGITLWPL